MVNSRLFLATEPMKSVKFSFLFDLCRCSFTLHSSPVELSRCNFNVCAAGNHLVLFGGEGVNMQPMDDTFVLNLDAANPEWQRMSVESSPPGHWGHALLCLNDSWLVIFGGCGRQGFA